MNHEWLFFDLFFFNCRVVLATGFIHILPEAMETLTDECLPDSWNVYGAYSGLFAMLAILGMQLIEFLAHQRYRSIRNKHKHVITHVNSKQHTDDEKSSSKGEEVINENQTKNNIYLSMNVVNTHGEIDGFPHTNRGMEMVEEIQNNDRDENRTDGENIATISYNDQGLDETEQPNDSNKKRKKKSARKHLDIVEQVAEVHDHTGHDHGPAVEILNIEPVLKPVDLCDESTHYHGAAFQDNGDGHKISTYLLELGIALHSVLIGLTLGTTTDSFVALFVALCFHQFFEAIALGAQIASLKTTSLKSAIFMVIFFSLTTPLGIAIGIGIHSGTYNPKSVVALLTTGILDSLAAGVLIYVALVNLITAEMGANAHGFYSLRARLKLLYFIALYLGAAAMAVIGRWA